MNYIDMFIIVLLVWAVFKGFTRGFVMQLSSLIALGLGIYLSLKLSEFTINILESHLNVSREALYLIALAMTFTLVFIGVHIMGRLVESMVETVELSFINRILGVLFSLVKTIFIIGILLIFIDRVDNRINMLPKNSQEHSFFFKPFTSVISRIFPGLHEYESDYNEQHEFVRNSNKNEFIEPKYYICQNFAYETST